ncbi:Pleckstrin -like proteiny domain-containing family A member 8 [Triplophysa tibetana]|uniref:Pleckstrin homology domain-containing family A member 8 n=1 Tax=Triplophysa tibetana TaxID=1572043 RepID=A0A5A9N078_9TELE|nr:Pleckstrin -like proteiny domain-containing family A member 8 [Triplophysa tibetana]
MEGVLYKWTNYISGWQPRWFVLDGGTLSYYDSQEDALKGCKGSIKISVCEIQVHPTDFTRLDLIIPGEQYFYLRAINAAERQKWLVALGTAKACLTDNRTKREKDILRNPSVVLCEQNRSTGSNVTNILQNILFCVLQKKVIQVYDKRVANETGSLVKSTCTTFLKTLEECMQIASRTFNPDLLSQTPPGSPPVATIKPQKIKMIQNDPKNQHPGEKLKDSLSISGSTRAHKSGKSEPEYEAPLSPQDNIPTALTEISLVEEHQEGGNPQNGSPSSTHDPEESAEEKEKHRPTEANHPEVSPSPTQNKEQTVNEEVQADLEVNELQGENKQEEEDKVDTFFSTMSHRFSDIKLEDGSGIPTQAFLDSCYAIVPVLDKLGPTVFAPVKMDFVGNIKKIQQKAVSDPDSFTTLQSIVLHEMETEVAQVRNSATEALLWLKRGLKFLKEFLCEINTGVKDVQGPLNKAYGKTLRQYHGWVIRGVFALALRAAPSYESFMAALVCHEGDELKEGFTAGMHRDLGTYLPAMEKQLSILDALYDEYGLESDEVV